jgi:hypothetical protein
MSDADVKAVAARMESIGRNCEFGFIQSHLGLEPISLLRWAGSNRVDLTRAVRERFSQLGDHATGRGDPPDRDISEQVWWLTDSAYNIIFHTPERPAETTAEEALGKTRARWKRLAEMQLDSFRAAEKLFLFSDQTLQSVDEVRDLFDAIREVGPAWLLVVLADPDAPGRAELIEPGLIVGYVGFLTNAGQATDFQFDPWRPMLRQAFDLWTAHHAEAA